MRKRLIFLAIFLFPTIAFSQLNFGLKVGINGADLINESSSIIRDITFDYTPKLSWNGGMIVNYNLSKKLDFSAELLYNNMVGISSNASDKERGVQTFHYLNFNYLALLSISPKLQLVGTLGTGLLVKNRFRQGANSIEGFPFAKSIDISVGPGMRYDILNRIDLEVRYMISVNRVVNEEIFYTDDGVSGFTEYLKFRNHVLQLNFIYLFSKN